MRKIKLTSYAKDQKYRCCVIFIESIVNMYSKEADPLVLFLFMEKNSIGSYFWNKQMLKKKTF